MSLRIGYNDQQMNTFNVTLQEKSPFDLPIGGNYQFKLTDEEGEDYINYLNDLSTAPQVYNRFEITTYINSGYTETNYPLEMKGWYDYEFSNGDVFENGKCYIFDNEDDIENRPDSTSYDIEKEKYIYKK